jgi:hypothetical protein
VAEGSEENGKTVSAPSAENELPDGFAPAAGSKPSSPSPLPSSSQLESLSFFSESKLAVVSPTPVVTPPSAPQATATITATAAGAGEKHKNSPEKQFLLSCFSEAHLLFPKMMIFKVANHEALPYFWDENIKKEGEILPISLDKAGFFKIAYKTQKPYHGYTVTNETNELFSKTWNSGITPEHLTIMPLAKKGSNVFGFLVGMANKNIDKRESLLLMTDLSQKITAKMSSFEDSAKAA